MHHEDQAVGSKLSARMAEHEAFRKSLEFQQEIKRLERVTFGLIELIRWSWMESSRYPPILDGLLMYTTTDDTIESVVAIHQLVRDGVHNIVRRECRYLLESATKCLFVDQQLPDVRTVTRDERLRFLKENVPRSSIEPIRDVQILLGQGFSVIDFHADVKDLWAKMAGYVHPSRQQMEERLNRAARGAYIGFEDARSLRRLVAEVARTYDMLGVFWLTAAGPSPAGDFLTAVETPQWVFSKSRWLPAMSRYFDYKAERH